MEKELGGKLGSGLSHQNGCKYLSSYGYENIGKSYTYTGRVKTLQTIKIRLFLDLHDSERNGTLGCTLHSLDN